METTVTVNIHPDATEVGADIERGSYRCIGIGPVSIFVSDRPALAALQAALDLIRDDMDAEEDAAMESA